MIAKVKKFSSNPYFVEFENNNCPDSIHHVQTINPTKFLSDKSHSLCTDKAGGGVEKPTRLKEWIKDLARRRPYALVATVTVVAVSILLLCITLCKSNNVAAVEERGVFTKLGHATSNCSGSAVGITASAVTIMECNYLVVLHASLGGWLKGVRRNDIFQKVQK